MNVHLGNTSLMIAVQEGHTDLVKILLENEAYVNIQNIYG